MLPPQSLSIGLMMHWVASSHDNMLFVIEGISVKGVRFSGSRHDINGGQILDANAVHCMRNIYNTQANE